jgi:hypothetical protein
VSKPKPKRIVRQRPIPGGREPAFSALDPRIQQWVHREAMRFGCSHSFVINNALSVVSNIELFDDYLQQRNRVLQPHSTLKFARR